MTSAPDIGPHPVGLARLRAVFIPAGGWHLASVEPDRIHTRFHGGDGAPAWLALVERR